MKKLLLLLLLCLGFIGSAYADAICRDGWYSASEGSGTCSWHKGVSEWTYDGRFEGYDNYWNENHRHGVPWLPAVKEKNNQLGYSQSIVDGAGEAGSMMGKAIVELINLVFGGNNQSNSQTLENGYFSNSIAHCNPGYDFKGYTDSNGYYKQRCVKNPCDIGYFKDRDTGSCMKVPENANSGATSWSCKSGYRKYLNKCINIPENAYPKDNTWYCNKGYYAQGNKCIKGKIE